MTLPGGKLVFKARSKEEAELFKNLSDDERVIFSFIKESGNSGSWIKHIKVSSDYILLMIFNYFEISTIHFDMSTIHFEISLILITRFFPLN